jgi:serine/threonine-protein kinase
MMGDSVRRRQAPRKHAARSRRSILPPWGWKQWVPLLIAAAILPFTIGYAMAVFVLFPAPPVAEAGIATPRLVGMREEAARRAVAQAGLSVSEVLQLPHPNAPAGVVIAQAPLPGQQLRDGGAIRLAVSAGAPRAVVPDVIGFAVDRAESLLRRLGFEVVRIDESDTEPAGRVLRTLPPAGRAEALPAQVRVYVSTGVIDTTATARMATTSPPGR